MSLRSAALIGAGSQGWVHAQALQAAGLALVAVADPNPAARSDLATLFDIPAQYAEAAEMLRHTTPDLVSITTPPAARFDAVRACIAAGVQAIHCEKPLATSYADVTAMVEQCQAAGVQLTANLQRRYEPVHRRAVELLRSGFIGDVVTIEGYCPNLPDWGTHIIDLILFYLDDPAAQWVMGQVDVRTNRHVYGSLAESASLTEVYFPAGVRARVVTGRPPLSPSLNLQLDTGLVVQGTEGRLRATGAGLIAQRFDGCEVRFDTPFSTDMASWERRVDPAIIACTTDLVADAVSSYAAGTTPAATAAHAAAGAEIIFATYRSARTRGRVELPMTPGANDLVAGIAAGEWQPCGESWDTF